jgi:beta-aspartyl-peptidase (threonine type)
MDDGRHILLVGPQALAFARRAGIEPCAPGALMVDRRQPGGEPAPETGDPGGGTVGAVAVDREGHVAAATSTGGVGGKLPGRVGDSAIIGAGTYADDRHGAVSATGLGEAIIRVTLARLAIDALARGGDPQAACREALAVLSERVGARCGLILASATGDVGYAYTSDAMPVAYMHAGLDAPRTEREGGSGRVTGVP